MKGNMPYMDGMGLLSLKKRWLAPDGPFQQAENFATRHGIVRKEIRFQSGTGHVFEKHQSTLPPEQPFEKNALIPANPPRLNTSTWRFLHVPTTTVNEINAYIEETNFSDDTSKIFQTKLVGGFNPLEKY